MINYLKKLGINAKKNEISISYETLTALKIGKVPLDEISLLSRWRK